MRRSFSCVLSVDRKLADISAMPQGVVKAVEELRDVIAYSQSNPTDAGK